MFVSLPIIKSYNDIDGLRKLLSKIETCVRNLRALDVETDSYGSLLVPLVSGRFPSRT